MRQSKYTDIYIYIYIILGKAAAMDHVPLKEEIIGTGLV